MCLTKKKKHLAIDLRTQKNLQPQDYMSPKNFTTEPSKPLYINSKALEWQFESKMKMKKTQPSTKVNTIIENTEHVGSSRRCLSRLDPSKIRSTEDSKFDQSREPSFIQEQKIEGSFDQKSFKIFGVGDSKGSRQILQNINQQNVSSLNAISKNDLLLITEENIEILDCLSDNSRSGPIYFESEFNSEFLTNLSNKNYIGGQNHTLSGRTRFGSGIVRPKGSNLRKLSRCQK